MTLTEKDKVVLGETELVKFLNESLMSILKKMQ